ncbi:hypothetical protein [Brunnivagina elsteri]|uniref:Uncharacterized protein n=1 Tax=Brunnivagina elsteri CCALA 953 TaxID=987040 RepID=A0A2A2TEC8_9CYAN|nr:hypothetical protein [Calothrix elsteri]PAX52008.1 hypothetical protein CK510_21635 [Calothrix elsteri CCALA 953]
MTTFVDDYGIWDSVGEVTVNAVDWSLFPGVIFNGETFRFSYTTDWDKWIFALDDRINIICRFRYGASSSNQIVSPSFRLYPKQDKEIRQYKITDKFRESELTERRIECKAIRRYNRFIPASAGVANLQLKIEYLL